MAEVALTEAWARVDATLGLMAGQKYRLQPSGAGTACARLHRADR